LLLAEWSSNYVVEVMVSQKVVPAVAAHGGTRLPSVDVVDYNVDLRDDEGFIGDRASRSAFRELIKNARKAIAKTGVDPLGDETNEEITKKQLDSLLSHGNPEAAGIIQGAIEEFAQEFALIVRRFLRFRSCSTTMSVVQGLSEIPFMTDVQKWGVFTIGTELGNACFSNRTALDD
jgi:hypothetical protein